MRLWCIIFSLLMFDAFAFFRGISPHVSGLYKACYINHSISMDDCKIHQVKNMSSFQPLK